MRIWLLMLTVFGCVTSIAYFAAEADKEDTKQRAFLGEACMKNGGEWQHDWSSHYNCVRPKQPPPPPRETGER